MWQWFNGFREVVNDGWYPGAAWDRDLRRWMAI
jgi:hypothetical protein